MREVIVGVWKREGYRFKKDFVSGKVLTREISCRIKKGKLRNHFVQQIHAFGCSKAMTKYTHIYHITRTSATTITC